MPAVAVIGWIATFAVGGGALWLGGKAVNDAGNGALKLGGAALMVAGAWLIYRQTRP